MSHTMEPLGENEVPVVPEENMLVGEVEIDEMKPFKRKYHQGRMLESHEQWLLVLIQRNPSKK